MKPIPKKNLAAYYLREDAECHTPLRDAVEEGELPKVVREFQEAGQTLSLSHLLTPDPIGRNCLYWALWEGYFDHIVDAVEASHEKLTIAPFLTKALNDLTPLHVAAEEGVLDQVMEALQSSGEKLTRAHFLVQDIRRQTPLSLAAEHKHLDQIFAPSYWEKRVGEMSRLWEEVPLEKRGSFDFEKARDEAFARSVQSVPKIDPQAFDRAARSNSPSLWNRIQEALLPTR